MRPMPSEYPPFAEIYISLVREEDIRLVLQDSITPLEQFLDSIPEDKADYTYAPGKWTVKQVLQHTIDTERVFAYRAMCIARGELQSLPGFDQDAYANNADVSRRSLESLKEEMSLIRVSTALLFEHLEEKELLRQGTASNHTITPLSLGYMIVGHWRHHEYLFRERYGC
ncbi:MAG: DinB family protein [Chitinophagaceae bacterium]|nr:DinB family protein [Chitinophagaceae bacterium]MCW5927676.1 DinB family protein [Chitinophagaceae bacterium]